ncbi:MAG: universal stress protein [Nitrospiraceae bacterium]|nr:MAG: universal stress protein [Nitrospiraceae bacterium]
MALSCPAVRLEKLLLSTDGSEFCEGAVREAIKLAKTCSSKLLAVSVIETNPEYETIAPQLVEKAEKATRSHLEAVKDRAAKEGVDCEIIPRQGEEPYKYVIEEAGKNKVDMIIMGRRGRTGLKRLMMGSETAKAIGHAPCNVLVVPRAAKIEFNRIVVATDGSKYSEAAVREAVGIAKRCGSTLIAVTVMPSEAASPFDIVHTEMMKETIVEKELKMAECIIKELKEASEKEGVAATGLIYSGKPFEAIINTAKEKMADLIVVGSHGRTGIDRLLMGSVTERVIGLSDCSVLVVKAS